MDSPATFIRRETARDIANRILLPIRHVSTFKVYPHTERGEMKGWRVRIRHTDGSTSILEDRAVEALQGA